MNTTRMHYIARPLLRGFAALAASVLLLSSAPALAAPGQGEGFTGPGPESITVAQAKSLADDSPVTLKGHIIKNLGGEKYLFQDSTGAIVVEIDKDVWAGQQIGPEDLVEIRGEADRDSDRVEIDVDQIIKH